MASDESGILPSYEGAYCPQPADMRFQRHRQHCELRLRADQRCAVWRCRTLQPFGQLDLRIEVLVDGR